MYNYTKVLAEGASSFGVSRESPPVPGMAIKPVHGILLVPHTSDFIPDRFILKGVWKEPNQSGFQYTLYQTEVTSDDYQKVTTDSSHVCQPIIRNEVSSRFILPRPDSLRYVTIYMPRCADTTDYAGS